eukprot:6151521-Pleurochrysis_carterae.AAC.1
MGWTEAPLGWPAAAQRIVQVLRRACQQGPGRGGGESMGGGEGDARTAAPRPAAGGKEATGTTAKLGALKSNAGEAGRRASAAAVLMPLTAPAVIAREAARPLQRDGLQAVARLVAEPEYGRA